MWKEEAGTPSGPGEPYGYSGVPDVREAGFMTIPNWTHSRSNVTPKNIFTIPYAENN